MQLDAHLARRAANHVLLSPVDFLERAVSVHPDRLAVVWRGRRWTYGGFSEIVRRLAYFLRQQGIGSGDVVSVVLPNRPEMLAAHYAVPLLGAGLNTINTRLDADTLGYILRHSGSRMLICDGGTAPIAEAAARAGGIACFRIDGGTSQEMPDLLSGAVPADVDLVPAITDEWQPLCGKPQQRMPRNYSCKNRRLGMIWSGQRGLDRSIAPSAKRIFPSPAAPGSFERRRARQEIHLPTLRRIMTCPVRP